MPTPRPTKTTAKKPDTEKERAPTHDTREAIELLAAAAHDLKHDTKGRIEAACVLLDELRALAGRTGVQITKNPGGEVGISVRVDYSVVVKAGEHGSLKLRRPLGDWEHIEGIFYNPTTKAYVAHAFDCSVAPTPGAPIPRRSALAIVVEAALKSAPTPTG